MKLLKPTWVSHDELPIFSVDIHPDGSRFATGGQGEDSGRIVIWNMAPLIDEDVENDENIPKMLCQMDNHLACVNCVRWSFSGKFLASGGDDKVVMIWKISHYATGNTVFGGGGKVNVETWRCSSTLRGHNGDVLDMAWSPNDAWLASCSVDNTVIVWNGYKMPEMVAVLKGHSGLVKGVTWDPIGKYIASQSDDKTLRVWRTVDWQQESVISEPFEECGGTTHVLRLSWSPDGQYLVSAHAMNGGGPTAQIVEREGWKQDKDFVGHRKAVTCVRFNSNILQKQYRSSSKPQQYCCCAIGSRDRSLSVWLTALQRPLVVLHELFANSVLDLSWSHTGLQLLACSWDGTVAFVEFSEDELGKPLSCEEKNSLHERMYGKSLSTAVTGNAMVVETADLLAVREKNDLVLKQKQQVPQPPPAPVPVKANSNPAFSAGVSTTLPDQSSQSSMPLTPQKGPINKQIEMRTSDGKRRITPMFIPPVADTGDVPTPFGATGGATAPTFRSSSEAKSSIMIEKRDVIVDPNVSRKSSDGTTPPGSATKTTSPNQQQLKVLVSGDARRDEPIVSSGPPPPMVTSKVNDRFEKAVSVKRRLDQDIHMASIGPSSKRTCMPSVNEPSGAPTYSSYTYPEVQSGLKLPVLKIGVRSVVPLPGIKRQLEVENGAIKSPYGDLTRVRVLVRPVPRPVGAIPPPPPVQTNEVFPEWEAVLGSTACGTAANNHVVVVACEDATLHVFTTATGQRPLPAFVLSAPVSRLTLGPKKQIMVVTSLGGVSVWDVETKKVMVKNESLLPIMQSEPTGRSKGSMVTITSSLLTENGFPLISLSTGRAYTFHPDLGTWLLLGNSNDPVQRSASHKNFAEIYPDRDIKFLPLSCIQANCKSTMMPSVIRMLHGTPVVPLCTVTYLEQQVSACCALDSQKEYHYWLMCLAQYLVNEGLEKKLRVLCDELLGPAHSTARYSKSWPDTVMGLSKHALLREVLDFMSKELRLQRLYMEYNDLLNEVAKSSSSSLPNGRIERKASFENKTTPSEVKLNNSHKSKSNTCELKTTPVENKSGS